MIVRLIASVGVAAGLALAPLTGDARVLVLPGCGGPDHLLVLPEDPAAPRKQGDCAKACHAITDRRGKQVGGKGRCC